MAKTKQAAPSAARKKVHVHQPPKARVQKNNALQYWLFAVAGFTLLAFFPSFTNEWTNWDDSGYVLENTLIKGLDWTHIKAIFTTFVQGNYHPLPILSYAVEYKFTELKPGLYHFTNTIFHVANALLVCYFIFRLSKQFLHEIVTARQT